MQSPAFGWRSDGIGGLALIGTAAATVAPFVGGFADRSGPRFSLLTALSMPLASWGILAVFGHAVIGIVAGMIVLYLAACRIGHLDDALIADRADLTVSG
jgi:hypothetical protein